MWDQRLRTVLKPAVRHLLGLWHLLQLGDSKGLNLNGSYPNTPASGSLWGTGWKRGRTGNKPATVSPSFNEPVSVIWLPCPRGFHIASPGKAVGTQGIPTTTAAPLGPSGPSQLCSKQQPKPVRSTQVFTTAALAVLHFSLKYTSHFLHQN